MKTADSNPEAICNWNSSQKIKQFSPMKSGYATHTEGQAPCSVIDDQPEVDLKWHFGGLFGVVSQCFVWTACSFFQKKKIHLFYVHGYFESMCDNVPHMCPVLPMPQESGRCPGTGVTESCGCESRRCLE